MTFTADEREALDLMRRAGAFRSHDEVTLAALNFYARHLDVDLHHDVFSLTRPVPAQVELPYETHAD